MARPKQSIAEQLAAAELAINVSLSNTEIQALLAGGGYTVEKLEEGRGLYQTCLDALHAQKNAIGAQQEATQKVKDIWEEAHEAYQALLGESCASSLMRRNRHGWARLARRRNRRRAF